MRLSRGLELHVLLLCFALWVTPALAARSSRDAFNGPGQGKLGPDLFLAISRADLAGVQALLARGADPNARDSFEVPVLEDAAASGDVRIVEAVLRAGAKLDAPTAYGTALTWAAFAWSAPMVKFLLAQGADPNPSRPDGITLLMYAARNGDAEIVNELLRRKVDINAKNGDGATALIYAARDGKVEVGRILLSSGASVDAADSHGWTALTHAAVNGQGEFVKLLMEKGANVNARDEKGRTPLILTATYGDHPEVLRRLLEGGADMRATDSRKRTALALAAGRGYVESAALLRERGADPQLAAAIGVQRTPKEAAQVGLAALQRSMREFTRNTGCVSCHQDGLGRMATGTARQCGLAIDQAVAQAQEKRIDATLAELRPVHLNALKDADAMKYVPVFAADGGDIPPFYGFMLAGMAAHRQPVNPSVAAAALVLARQQLPDGHWFFGPRGPMQSSFFTMTALAIEAIQTYATKDHADEVAERLRRAKTWLLAAPAETSEDKAFRLLGLKWAGTNPEERRKAIDELRAGQRPDGGWPQPFSPQSDAYGTGQALYALRVGGEVPITDPAYQKGLQFLLRTQEEDGSWFVPKRVAPGNVYFDAAFPHGEAQYASFNATCWATMALMESIEPAHSGALKAAR